MKPSSLLLLGASLLTSSALAELSYTAKMTHHGIEVPIEFTALPPRHNQPLSSHSKRQSISSTANWAGAILRTFLHGIGQLECSINFDTSWSNIDYRCLLVV
jgi:hypothetical protein